MLGWFSPKCPVDTWEKTWTETRMRWLAEQFGIDRLLKAEVILPTEEYFPDPYKATREDARRMMDRLCTYMAIPPQGLQLEICQDVQLPGVAGHYDNTGRPVIRVAESQLTDPQRLVATLAHELAHELLHGRGLLTAEVEDHEWVTDLLPVYLGVGVFAANSTLSEEHDRVGNVSWWSIARQGYLPARIFGYAFALFALLRGEEDPAWVEHLRLDAAAAMRDGLRYLRKTGDSLFHPDTIRTARRPPTASELVERLQTGSPSVRLAALWEIRDHPVPDPDLLRGVIHCLGDGDRAIPGAAARALAGFGAPGAEALPFLTRALSAGHPDTRAGAADALGALGLDPQAVVPELCAALQDANRRVVAAAVGALRRFGPWAETAIPRLLATLRGALIECDEALIGDLAATLLAITPDIKRHVREHFSERDPELRRLALEALKEEKRRARLGQAPPDKPGCMLVKSSFGKPAVS
jgi:HEAT repeat protein